MAVFKPSKRFKAWHDIAHMTHLIHVKHIMHAHKPGVVHMQTFVVGFADCYPTKGSCEAAAL
jgi:hypothetical protein